MISSQWDYSPGSSTHLYKEIPLVGDGTSSYNVFQMTFAGEYYGGSALQWAVEILDSSGNTRLYTTGAEYYDVNQMLVVGLPKVTPSQYSQHTDIVYRCHIWVKKKNGGNIDRTDMYASNFTWFFNRSEEVGENTFPAEWLETTTASIPELTTYTTVATTVPYEGVLTTLTIPADIRPAIAQFEQIIYDLWNLHYMPFIIIFGILVALAAWLLH